MTIYETVVFDGATKDWRIFNITTGSLYSKGYDLEKDAFNDIEDDQLRDGHVVKRITREQISELIDFNNLKR